MINMLVGDTQHITVHARTGFALHQEIPESVLDSPTRRRLIARMSSESTQISGVVATGAGLFALWDRASFPQVIDYETWEAAMLEHEHIARHVVSGALVPVNIGADGAFHMTARWGSAHLPAALTDRERRCVLVSSEQYLLRSGGSSWLSGVEHIEAAPTRGLAVPVTPDRWNVTVHLIDWDRDRGSRDEAGEPNGAALSDFVLLMNPALDLQQTAYRTQTMTFDRPQLLR